MKIEKTTPVLLGIILVLLIGEFVYAVYHQINFQEKIDDGNERWHQVEKILQEYDERIKSMEEVNNCGRSR